jgi:hypothetical protein
MYLRITRGRGDPAVYDEVVALSRDVAAAIGRLPGFGTYLGGGDRGGQHLDQTKPSAHASPRQA